MIRLILGRAARGLATILLVATLVFVVVRLTGDPVRAVVPENASEAVEALYRQRWGLDRPLWEQYVIYLGGIARGDFGQSYFSAAPAFEVVMQRVPATLALTVPAFVLSTILGVAIGVFAALRRGRALDRILMSTSVVAGAIPSFVVGIFLVLLFSVALRWLPSAGNQTPQHLILPIIALTIPACAYLARMTRASMSDALVLPSVGHARALGMPRWRQVLSYALPSASLPLITVLGFELAYLVAGSSVVEALFGWPGVGRLLVQASGRDDFAVVQAIVILVTVSVVLFLALTDIAYRVVDPRLRVRAA